MSDFGMIVSVLAIVISAAAIATNIYLSRRDR